MGYACAHAHMNMKRKKNVTSKQANKKVDQRQDNATVHHGDAYSLENYFSCPNMRDTKLISQFTLPKKVTTTDGFTDNR